MAVMVSDLLTLPLLQEGRVIAGVGGLSRSVRAVSFSDYPIIFSEEEYDLTSKGDLYICSYYLFQESMEKLYDRIRFYIKTKSSCLIISVGLQEELSSDIIALANQNNYPLILVSDKIPYTAIIRTITEAIFLDETSAALENKVDSLLYDKLSSEEIAALAKHFYSFPSSDYIAAFFSLPESEHQIGNMRRELDSRFRGREFSLCRYKIFVFLIVQLKGKEDFATVKNLIHTSLNQLGTSYYLGFSTPHCRSSEFSSALRQAYQSCRIGIYQQQSITEFGQIPLLDLLYELRHSASLTRFCQNTLHPLMEYKEQHSIDLIETLRVFFQNNGNYKQTAADLFQHENTIRFRVGKAKSLLGMEKETYRFIKEVSLAIDCFPFLRDNR